MGGRSNDDPDDGADEQDWVFDDRFVAGGIREDSLRRPPPSGPRNPLGNPSGPRDWAPSRPGGSTTSPRRRLRVALVVLAAAVGVLGLIRFAATSNDGPTPIAAPDAAVTASTAVHDRPAEGLSPTSPVGTCLIGTAPGNEPVRVRVGSCRTRHNFELVATERAAGTDDSYPADSYWNGPVAQRCYADLRRYTGQPRDRWPGYLSSTQFVPLPNSWAAGDRVVQCIAELSPASTGSVHHLRSVRPSVIGTSAAPSTSEPSTGGVAVSTSLTGRLTVLTRGSDVCLGVHSSAGTIAVVTSAPGLSWSAYVDADARPVTARSGIATAAEATPNTIRWHPGDRVTLTGGLADGAGETCGATSLLAVDTVRTAD